MNIKTQEQVTIDDIVGFIVENRKDNVFKDWTKEQLEFEVERATDDKTFLYAFDNVLNKIVGIVVGRKLESVEGVKIMHIVGILATKPGVVFNFMRIFRQLYPDYSCVSGFKTKTKKIRMFKNSQFGKLQNLLAKA